MTATRHDDGAGSALVLAVVAAALLLVGLLVPLYMGLGAKRALTGAADAAALAGAEALSGAVPGFPCEVAEQIAGLNRASLDSCRVEGSDVIVAVSGVVLGLPIGAAARAGPPPDTPGHAEQSPSSD